MFLQISKYVPIAGILVLSACSGGVKNQRDPNAELVACALDGASSFTKDCTVERHGSENGLVLTIGREDKGYRRFVVPTDGRGIIAADGADAAKVTITGDNLVEVMIGKDRYQLPATIKQGK